MKGHRDGLSVGVNLLTVCEGGKREMRRRRRREGGWREQRQELGRSRGETRQGGDPRVGGLEPRGRDGALPFGGDVA